MSRKLSLATLALGAMLLAVPVVAQQQPDSTKPAATKTMTKKHARTKAMKHKTTKAVAKDSTKK